MITPERYWNTWYPEPDVRMEHLSTGFTILPGAFSELEHAYSTFPYDENMRYEEHESSGAYCRARCVHAKAEFEIEYLRPDPWTVLLRMTNTAPPLEWGIRYHMLVSLGFVRGGGVMEQDGELVRGKIGNYHICAAFAGEEPYDCVSACEPDYVGLCMADKGYKSSVEAAGGAPGWMTSRYVLEQTEQVCLAVSIAHDPETAEKKAKQACTLFGRWEREKADALSRRPESCDALHPGMTEAVADIMAWNATYSPELNRTYSCIAKTWNRNFGGWYTFFSDSCYQILMTALTGDPEMAMENLELTLSTAAPDGNFTGMYCIWEKWVDRTQPPVLGYCLLTCWQATGNLESVRRAYPLLRRAQKWYLARRRRPGETLVRLGTSRTGNGKYRGSKMAAKAEAAMDNSPMYDEAGFDKSAGLLEMTDIGVNSQLALDLECTARLARLIGEDEDAAELERQSQQLKDAIRVWMWDEENGIFANRRDDGGFGLTSPTSFYALAAGAADEDQAEACLEHIFDPEEFFTECPLIAINGTHSSARENRYWRGRTWAPQSFWTWLGLRRCGWEREAFTLAERAVRHFARHWEEKRRSYENFDPFTGAGGDVADCQPFYSWTALLPLMWSMEQFSVTPWEGLSFGMYDGAAFSQKNRLYRGQYYDAVCDGARTELRRGGAVVFRSDLPARFRNFTLEEHYAAVSVRAPRDGWAEFPGVRAKMAMLNGESVEIAERFELPEGENELQLWF